MLGPTCWPWETIPDVDEAEALVTLQVLARCARLAQLHHRGHTQPRRSAVGRRFRGGGRGTGNRRGRGQLLRTRRRAAGDRAGRETGKPVIFYPNSGEQWDSARRAWVGPSRFSPQLAVQWVAAGARVVGGCCRVRPADIAELAAALG